MVQIWQTSRWNFSCKVMVIILEKLRNFLGQFYPVRNNVVSLVVIMA